jgi:type II secretory ATPase GspE/PulE/Tfp pilus assembly ATPase PilB-like protein
VLSQVMTVPRGVSGPLLSRLKLMAGMDIAERRRPQDGRTRLRTAAGDVDLRVSSLPSLYGETLVVRLLRKGAERLGIADVGLGPEELATVLPLVERPQGLVLLTGPTGSGKTSSLYAFLGHLAGESSKIITIEDPVEYELPGVSQTQVNERIGLTFSRALRTVLRQDPDVVMVGEIRDPETAELALQASLTGHLVFSTLHTNDAAGAIVRLRDLGIPAYLIASSLSLVIAQRLVRRVCVHCATTADVSKRQASLLHLPSSGASKDGGGFRTGSGCGHCGETGYRGRSGLFEILSVDERVRELIGANAAESAIRHAGRVAGMQSLREDGLAKARRGETTLDEVLRVTPGDVVTAGACPACGQRVEEDYAVCPWCAADRAPTPAPSAGVPSSAPGASVRAAPPRHRPARPPRRLRRDGWSATTAPHTAPTTARRPSCRHSRPTSCHTSDGSPSILNGCGLGHQPCRCLPIAAPAGRQLLNSFSPFRL